MQSSVRCLQALTQIFFESTVQDRYVNNYISLYVFQYYPRHVRLSAGPKFNCV